MSTIEYLMIALGLSMDAFAVCLGAGVSPAARAPRATFRLAFHFGLFQFLMPVIGWFLGRWVGEFIGWWDHWVAFGILALVGMRMILGGLKSGAESAPSADPSRGWTLVLLSIATSVDAWAVGMSLAMLDAGIWYPATLIGLITTAVCAAGVQLGKSVAAAFGKRVEILGGVILLACGVKVVLSHTV